MIAAPETDVEQLIAIFDRCFRTSHKTMLVRGSGEPIYLPADDHHAYHRIVFAHGYFASALHEIAHWCIAGAKRRLREDYGYWYRPDGRNQAEQQAFEQAEIKPQALEWIFSVAAGHAFVFSADNLEAQSDASSHFKQAVWQQVCHYVANGMPRRAHDFAKALRREYGNSWPPEPTQFPAP